MLSNNPQPLEKIESSESDNVSNTTEIIHSVNTDISSIARIEVNNLALNNDDEQLSFWESFKEISSLSAPMALSFTFSFEMFLITILLNYLSSSEDELAATTLITTMINVLSIIGMSPLFAMDIMAGNKVGELKEDEKKNENEELLEQKREYISTINRAGLWLGAGLAVPVISGFVFSKPIFTTIFGQQDNVAQVTQNFLRTYSPAALSLMVRMSTERMLFSFGKAKEAMVLALASLAIGSGTAAWLGFGGLGVPKLGSQGIAIGFVVESYLTALAYSLYLAKHKDFNKFEFFNLFKSVKEQSKRILEMLKIGTSIAISETSEMATSISLGGLSGALGVRPQSVISITTQVSTITFLVTAATAQANSIKLNNEIGAKKYRRANSIGKHGLFTTLIYTLPIPVFFAISPQTFLISSHDKKNLAAMLKYVAPLISAGIITDSVRYNVVQQLRVLGDVNGSTIISASGLSVGIVTSALLGLKTQLGIYGVAIGYAGGTLIAFPGLLYRWSSRIQAKEMKKKVELQTQPVSFANYCGGFFNRCLRKPDVPNIEDLEKGKLIENKDTLVKYGGL